MFHSKQIASVLWIISLISISGCDRQWNNPYPLNEANSNILYSSFSERPNHLDPARSYSSNEYTFIGQIYEPPLQYHYLKRPYSLVPLTAQEVPTPKNYNAQDQRLPDDADPKEVAYSIYEIHIKPDIQYQPHPAFAMDEKGEYRYHNLSSADLMDKHALADFPITATRELVASDYVYQIKRLAHPKIHSPILGLMSEYIVGLQEYAGVLDKAYQQLVTEQNDRPYLDLNLFPLSGVKVIDRYTYQIKIQGTYPQLVYWLAMPFFAPMAPEADRFYSQPGMKEKNITLDWYPVGTGPYMLTINNPNRQMILQHNPNFHGEAYPVEGESEDRALNLLSDAGAPMPFINKVVYSLEKENIPYWNKFLQGYYDTSGITSDSFDQAVSIGSQGEASLTEDMQKKGIRLLTAVGTSTIYLGFNMQDPIIGGYSEEKQKLRQAISIAVDMEEFISIFLNGRGVAAQGALPPGIFGHRPGEQGVNPYVYDWVNGQAQRKPIAYAKQLLVEAGYPNGIQAKTGKPLVVNLDITASGPDDKARLDWYRKQFQKIDVQLVVRNTDYNRFQDKMRKGTAQIFFWGWNADYPDPENFMFLLNGPNGKVDFQGENAANYDNPEFNKLFDRMKTMPNSVERQTIIDNMAQISQRDSPWIWGYHPKSYGLYHAWYVNTKPNIMANNTLKYKRLDPQLRKQKRAEWNKPVLWPVGVISVLLIASIAPAVMTYRRKERHAPGTIAPSPLGRG